MANLSFSFRFTFIILTLRNFAIIFTLAAASIVALAQSSSEGTTPAGLAPGSPAGSFALSGFDTISPFSGKINFKLPLLQIGGRGKAGYTMTYDYNQIWQVDRMTPEYSSYTYQYATPYGWTGGAGVGPGFMAVRTIAAQKVTCPEGTPQMEKWSQSQTRLTFTSSDGTEYEFLDALNSGAILTNDICNPYQNYNHRGKVWITRDGSSATFITDADIYDNQSNPNAGQMATQTTMYAPVSGMMILRDGTKYRIDNGGVSWIRDTNGNKVTFTSTSTAYIITDSLGRQVTVSIGVEPAVITYKGVGGASRQIKFYHNTLDQLLRSDFSLPLKTTQQLFPNLLGSATAHNPTLVSYIELPDGRKYYFKYNYYAELARVELPTGGAYEYDWGGGPGATAEGTIYEGYYPGLYNIQEIYRRVSQRRIYKEGNVLEGKMVFTAAHSHYNDPRPWTTNVKVEEQNAGGTTLSASKHYYNGSPSASMIKHTFDFSEWNEGKEYQTEALASDGVTVLRKSNMAWQQRATGPFGLYSHSFFLEGANDPRMVESTTTLLDVSPNLVSKQTHIHPTNNTVGYDQYNNLTDTWEYDFGSGAVGSFIRRTHLDYLTSGYDTVVGGISAPDPNATIHLRSLPTGQKIYSDIAGTVKKAEKQYEYDNYTPDANNYHATLVNRTNISGLDPVSTTSLTMRGNATKVSSWRNTDNAFLNAYSQYDIAGNVVKSIDANGNASLLEYTDRFGAPNGEAQSNTVPSMWLNGQTTFAFPSKVTNAAGHIEYTQFDYYLGKAVDTEDPNNVKSSIYYDNDALDRPTKSIRAFGTPLANQTLITYDDVNRTVTTSTDKTSNMDGVLQSKSYFDGLGRTYRSAIKEDTTWAITETQFDALGRAYRSTNPFRGTTPTVALPASPGWTTTTFDALGRALQVTSPDNAVVSTSYSGNQVVVTDQAGKQRKSETDVLGRLLKIWEAPNDANFNHLTTYAYDTLDNLTTVNQGTQSRSFVYDSLKRLNQSVNPESGTTTYTYDNNSNLLTKTDANSITTTYAYDVLNRNVTVGYSSYSNGTAFVETYYDNAPNGKGKFHYNVKYNTESNGTLNYNYDQINNYDALGRPTSKSQNFLVNQGGWTWKPFTTTATYDLAGNVLSQTYPSGRTVNYAYNAASQATSFTGNLGGTATNYATSMNYTAAGLLARETFGTTTALYHRMNYNVRQQMFAVRLGTDSNAALDVNPQAAGLTDYSGWGSSWDRGMLITHYGSTGATNDFSIWGTGGTNNNGNVLRSHHYIPGGIYVNDYEYDNLNRIKKDTGWGNSNYVQAFDYDRWGNRTINQSLTTTSPDINKKLFAVNTANNRLGIPSGQTGTMTFDPAGNLIFDSYTNPGKIDAMAYDAENKMTSAANGGHQYRYNAMGKRVKRIIAGQGEFWMVYGIGGELVAEYNATSGIPAQATPNKEYGYRNGQMLVVWDDTETDANLKLKWLVQDHLGSTRMEIGINGAANAVVRHDYLPFGEELAGSMRSAANGYGTATKTKQKFTEHERDTETGLDFMKARYSSSVQGRFLTVDSFGGVRTNPQSLNRYSYVFNMPLKYNDPTGHVPEGWSEALKEWVRDTDGSPLWVPHDEYVLQQTDRSKLPLWIGSTYQSSEGFVDLDPNGPSSTLPQGWRLNGIPVGSTSQQTPVNPAPPGELYDVGGNEFSRRERDPFFALLSMYEKARVLRLRGHALFPDSGGLDASRHRWATRQSALMFGVPSARAIGITNEIQGFIMHDIPNLPSRLQGRSHWAFEIRDLQNNELGIDDAENLCSQWKTTIPK